MAKLTTIKVEKNQNYTIMSNWHLRDKELSLKAKGLMSYMLSLPPEWDFSVVGLASCLAESKNTIGKILNELIDKGYMERKQERQGKLFSGYSYILHEISCRKSWDTKTQYPKNEAQINTKEINTKEINIGGKAPRGTKKDFVPPTLEDIRAYISEKVEAGKTEYRNVDVNTFFDYYNEADWHMSNGRKIKSWKQCLITWASREWNKKQEPAKKEEVKRPIYADEIFTEEEMQIW
jgi:hypothetical protein